MHPRPGLQALCAVVSRDANRRGGAGHIHKRASADSLKDAAFSSLPPQLEMYGGGKLEGGIVGRIQAEGDAF